MAVSGVSSSPTPSYQNSSQSDFRQTFGQLVNDIKSGNLSDAQQDYSQLTQLQSNGEGPPANTPLGQALSQIGQSLQKGDINGAQQTLTSLSQQQQTQGSHHHHHHHHGSSSSSSTASSPASSTASSSGSTTIDLTA